MSFGLVILGLIVVLAVIVVVIYNRLVALRQTTNQAWGDIDVQLKQRHDLVPNLVETVKGYASHERETLDAVVKARNAAVAAGDVKDLAQAESMLTGALRQIFALAEAYPDLKANTNFMQLQAELADIENKIAAARRFFNNAVAEYNTAQEQFPAALFAKQFGFEHREFFEVADRAVVEAAPKVSFS
jgi:LemA protein